MKSRIRSPIICGAVVAFVVCSSVAFSMVAGESRDSQAVPIGFLWPQMPAAGHRHPVVNGWAHRFGPSLKCSPAPCAFENVQASEGGNPVNETPIVVDPNNPRHILTAGNDYNCGINFALSTGLYASSDGGSTWSRACTTLGPGNTLSGYDPTVAYDLNDEAFYGTIQGRPGTSR